MVTINGISDTITLFRKSSGYEDWDDMRIVPSAFDFAGASDPTLINYQPGGSGINFKVWEFENDDQAFFTVQMPHNWKVGSDIYPHVHWTPGPNGETENTKTVDWKLDYSVAPIGSNFPASATLDMISTCSGVNHKHEMSPVDANCKIAGASLGISAMLLCRIYRGADAADTWAGTLTGARPILLEVDFHYKIDSLGSDAERSKT